MIPKLVIREGELWASQAASYSREALDRAFEGDAELSVIEISSQARVLGAFQRAVVGERAPTGPLLVRRGSGGGTLETHAGTLHVLLALRHPGSLVACDPRRVMNRYVRPLLRALTRTGVQAHYFGRDWVSAAQRPIAVLGCAHDSKTRRTVFEAFVATQDPLVPIDEKRASFLGKEPTSLASIVGRSVDVAALRRRIVDAYVGLCECDCANEPLPGEPTSEPGVAEEPPWSARVAEAIGELGAGGDAKGIFRFGGDLLASRDAVERVALRVADLEEATPERVGQVVDEELAPSAVLLEGVRDLRNVRDLLVEGRRHTSDT